jgi:hypothetical protein
LANERDRPQWLERSYTFEGNAGEHRAEVIAVLLERMLPRTRGRVALRGGTAREARELGMRGFDRVEQRVALLVG